MEKHKAIAIPVCFIDGEPHFLLVHDRRHSEWTFVTGGCKTREIAEPIVCALRELEEETRGVIDLDSCSYSYFSFSVLQTELEKNDFTAVYHVYIIDFETTIDYQKYLKNRFYEEKRKMDTNELIFRKQYDENDMMDFDTLEGLKKRNVWNMIRVFILDNPEFYKHLYSRERTHYVLK
jgi:8-oxo-dGTP pyrophosphatase MutT (NUDIX family)